MKRLVLSLMLCFALPVAALAVTEGVVEEAAAVDVMVTVDGPEESYTLDPSYYAFDYGYEPEWGASETYVEPEFDGECFYPCTQTPSLTSGEIVRAKRLLAAYQSGEAAGDGSLVLNAEENVALGVYPIDPADYDGERVYVILPNVCLTDAQLLALMDAYAQLGLTFDPEELNSRNCMRGGGIECTRFLTDEEQERRTTLANLIRRGRLTGVTARDEVCISLDTRYFNGLDSFSMRPYRRMTDEELAGQLVAQGMRDESAELDFDGVERRTRELLTRAFSCPMSMKLETIGGDGSYLPCFFDENGAEHYASQSRKALYTNYKYPKEGFETVYADVFVDAETGRAVILSVTDIPIGWVQSEKSRDPAVPDEAYIASAKAFAEANMTGWIAQPDRLVWRVTQEQYTNYGPSVCVQAYIPQTCEMLFLYVGCGDMQVHHAQLQADQRGWFEDVEFETDADLPVNG